MQSPKNTAAPFEASGAATSAVYDNNGIISTIKDLAEKRLGLKEKCLILPSSSAIFVLMQRLAGHYDLGQIKAALFDMLSETITNPSHNIDREDDYIFFSLYEIFLKFTEALFLIPNIRDSITTLAMPKV